ncbi:MAG: hypothetical protein AB7D43_13715, partial [Sulfurimonadaceae bacterium]
MNKQNKAFEQAIEKLIESAVESESKSRELAFENMHPLLKEAYNIKDHQVSELIISTVEKKAMESLETIIKLAVESTWLLQLLKIMHDRTVAMFGDRLKVEEFAMFHMNSTKEKLLEIFSEPFDVAENTKYDFVSAREYVTTLESYQTASLLVDFAIKFEGLLDELESKKVKKETDLSETRRKIAKDGVVKTRAGRARNKELIGLLNKYQLKQYELAEILGM